MEPCPKTTMSQGWSRPIQLHALRPDGPFEPPTRLLHQVISRSGPGQAAVTMIIPVRVVLLQCTWHGKPNYLPVKPNIAQALRRAGKQRVRFTTQRATRSNKQQARQQFPDLRQTDNRQTDIRQSNSQTNKQTERTERTAGNRNKTDRQTNKQAHKARKGQTLSESLKTTQPPTVHCAGAHCLLFSLDSRPGPADTDSPPHIPKG